MVLIACSIFCLLTGSDAVQEKLFREDVANVDAILKLFFHSGLTLAIIPASRAILHRLNDRIHGLSVAATIGFPSHGVGAIPVPDDEDLVFGDHVELGAIDPEQVITPGIFVKRVVQVERVRYDPTPAKRGEEKQ